MRRDTIRVVMANLIGMLAAAVILWACSTEIPYPEAVLAAQCGEACAEYGGTETIFFNVPGSPEPDCQCADGTVLHLMGERLEK